jgi:hypothetical protein
VTVDGVTTNLHDWGYNTSFEKFAVKYEAAHAVEETIGGVPVTSIDSALRENHAVHWEYITDFETPGISDALYSRAQQATRTLQSTQSTLMKSLGTERAGEVLKARVDELWPTWTRDQVANEMREGFSSWQDAALQETAKVEVQQRSQDRGMSF